MTPLRWQTIEDIFHAAFELKARERVAFLDSACGGDTDLRAEVESLLSESGSGGEFLSKPLLSLGLSVLRDEPDAALVGETIGSFEVLDRIASGGMGEVYLAQDSKLNRLVALKLLPSYITEKRSIHRFMREARAASAISHPNVAHIYEIGEANGRPYTAMEFVDGSTLRSRLSNRSLNFGEAGEIAIQIGLGIAAAHTEGIIHRDIKPENIMIRHDGLVKVVDFGLAKLTKPGYGSINGRAGEEAKSLRPLSTQTEAGSVMGTVNYMSPEQARGQVVDTRTDIWSWGAVLYEMLTGDPPFKGATGTDTLAEILKGTPKQLNPLLSAPAARIIDKTLAKDKEDRYSRISEAIDDLRELLRDPSSARLLEHPLPVEAVDPGEVVRTGAERIMPQSDDENPESPEVGWLEVGAPQSRKWKKPMTTPAIAGSILLLLTTLGIFLYGFISRSDKQSANLSAARQIELKTRDGRIKDVAISPDGGFLAWVSMESGNYSLWIQNRETGTEALHHTGQAVVWGMRFVPNSNTLLYNVRPPDGSINTLKSIQVGGDKSYSILEGIANPPAVSPDSTQIAFVRKYPNDHLDKLYVSGIDGGNEREFAVRHYPDTFSTGSASWSPDGRLIAIGAGRNNGAEKAVLAFAVNGDPPIELTPWEWADVAGVAWNSDGRTLVFSARAPASKVLRLWKLSYPGGSIESLTGEENAYEEVTLASNIGLLVSIYTYEVSDIWLAESSGDTRRLTTQGREGADGLAVTEAGTIVYTHGEYEQSTLWSMNLKGGERKQLTPNSAFLPSASRDGRIIAYVSIQDGTRHIWLLDSEGGNRQMTGGEGENFPAVSADGDWIIYSNLAKDDRGLWKIPTTGGPAVQLTNDGIYVKPVISPDGTMIACIYKKDDATTKWSVVVLPIAGGAPIKSFAIESPRYKMFRWTPDNKALVYTASKSGVYNLWQQELDGPHPKQITFFTEDEITHHDRLDAASPFVLARGGRRRDIALIKNF